jgi:hypothetical protein
MGLSTHGALQLLLARAATAKLLMSTPQTEQHAGRLNGRTPTRTQQEPNKLPSSAKLAPEARDGAQESLLLL